MSGGIEVARRWGPDYRVSEVTLALLVALSVPVWSAILLSAAELSRPAEAPEIVAGSAVPIKIVPMLDMDAPILKKGGKRRRAILPDMWKRKKPAKQKKVVTRKTHASTKAKDDVSEIPPDDLKASEGKEPPDPDAEVVKNAELENVEEPDDSQEGTGGGSAAGSEHGTEPDPLKARAASMYHGRVLGFLKRGFSCPSLPAGEKKCSPSASVIVSASGTVTSFSFNACGVAAIDSAARAAIASKVGQQVPPAPPNYPELQTNQFSVAYVCR